MGFGVGFFSKCNYAAATNTRYRADTSGGWFRLYLPASVSENDWITWVDVARSFGANKLSLQTNTQKIEGYGPDATGLYVDCDWDRCNGTLIYTGSTYGWKFK